MEAVGSIFGAEEVVTKGMLADFMFQSTSYRQDALEYLEAGNFENWTQSAGDPYVREAGWYFKTLAVQEIGKNLVLAKHSQFRLKNGRGNFFLFKNNFFGLVL